MIKGKMGSASPIRKAFVAFKTAFVTHPLVVLSFEEKITPEACNMAAMHFGVNLGVSALSLPQGVFNLNEAFYKTSEITLKAGTNGEPKTYASIGDFADSLDYGEPDYLDSEYWLKEIAGMLCEGFQQEKIPFPSQENLSRMFLVGDSYKDVQESLQWSFKVASDHGKLEDILLDAMTEYHTHYVEYAKEKSFFRDSRAYDTGFPFRTVHSMLPFEIVSEVSVGATYDAFLPVILASGIRVNQEKLFRKRIERGRAFLKDFMGNDFDEANVRESLAKAIRARTRDFQSLLPDDLIEALSSETNSVGMAAVLHSLIWSDEKIEKVSVTASLLSDLFESFE